MNTKRVTLLQTLVNMYYSSGINPGTRRARQWMINKMKDIRVSPNKLLADKRVVHYPRAGQMYFFWYDAIHKKTLPYWDQFPIVLPIWIKKGYMLGLNLHYIPTILRARLLDKLMDFANNERYDETTKIRLSYNLLAAATRYEEFKPCLKMYKLDHIASALLPIHGHEWEVAILLPVERFVGKTKLGVWRQSMRSVRGQK